jgi:hypothetical protein
MTINKTTQWNMIAGLLLLTVMGCGQSSSNPQEVVVKAEQIPGIASEYYEVFYLGQKEVARQRFTFSERKDRFNPIMLDMTGQVPDGPVKAYYPSGALMATMTYQANVKDGLYSVFYEDGTIKGETLYVQGDIQGVMKGYYPNGALQTETSVDGWSKGYYEDGTLKYEMDDKNNIFNLYDEQGNLYPRSKFTDREFMKKFFAQ